MQPDVERAIDRIAYAIREEPERRVVFIVGSGLSIPDVPGTLDMVRYFLDEAGLDASRYVFDGSSAAEKYQEAAYELRQRRGESGLARAIRKAVAGSYGGNIPDLESITSIDALDDHKWHLPAAQTALGQLIAQIPRERQGPIFTTNFDPLTEVALRLCGLNVTPIALPATQAIHLDGIHDTLPVVHLHGYWLRTATLSTVKQVLRARPDVEGMIKQQLSGSLIVVIGVGGWDDSFLRALGSLIDDGSMGLLRSEVLWMLHDKVESVSLHPFLSSRDGAPSLNIYAGIDGAELLGRTATLLTPPPPSRRFPIAGWWYVPSMDSVRDPTDEDLISFIEGTQPHWPEAKTLPILTSTSRLITTLQSRYDAARGATLISIGPTGEGKSLGLKQAALRIRALAGESTAVLFRKPGAPKLTESLIEALLNSFDRVIFMSDEADLLVTEVDRLVSSLDGADANRLIWVFAMHSHYASKPQTRSSLNRLGAVYMPYNGITRDDSEEIAKSWLELGLLPDSYRDQHYSVISQLIMDSSASAHGDSIFAAALHLWMGEDLVDRIAELLVRLQRTLINGITLRSLLGAIAMVQVAWDPDEANGSGMHSSVLAHMLNLVSADVYSMLIEPLGREVGISIVGECVYVRHPTIAQCIIDNLELDEYLRIAYLVGLHGGQMRTSAAFSNSQSRSAFLLCRRTAPVAKLAAARGAIEGAPELLEPRVSYLASCRDVDKLAFADRYASRLANELARFRDQSQSMRGFLVEWATIKGRQDDVEAALGLSVLAISDLDAHLDLERLKYGLVSAASFSKKLALRNVDSARQLHDAVNEVLQIVQPDENLNQYRNQSPHRSVMGLVDVIRRASAEFQPAIFVRYPWQFKRMLRLTGQYMTRDRPRSEV